MTSTARPPVGLEYKAAATMLAPAGPSDARRGPAGTTMDGEHGEVVALVTVTGVEDDVQDVIEPGAFRRSLKIRTPRMCVGHDWGRVAGRTVVIAELMPGDHRLPRTTPDGTPWPPEAGALLVNARFLVVDATAAVVGVGPVVNDDRVRRRPRAKRSQARLSLPVA